MNLHILQPIRWQASLAAVLAVACATGCGAWLAAGISGGSSLTTLELRTLPRLPVAADDDTRLQEQMQELRTEQKQVEAQIQSRDSARKELEKRVSAAQQQAMSLSTENSPEKLAVMKLREQTPRWTLLDLAPAEMDTLAQVWDSRSTQAERAVAILEEKGKAWQAKASAAATSGTTARQQRLAMLKELKERFDKESAAVVAVLNVDDLGGDKTDPLLAAIRKIIETFGGGRAVAGVSFTNSAGMEMIWVPQGGFWLGRTEVTSAAYKEVNGTGGGSDSPAEGISFLNALEFCERLTKRENDYKTVLPPGRSLRPVKTQYTFPTVRQWRLGRDNAEALGLEGFSNGLSEWSQDQQKSGLATQAIVGGAASSWFLALNGQSAVALPPTTTGSIVQSGTATKATGMAGRIEIWSGRLGLRVILLPTQTE